MIELRSTGGFAFLRPGLLAVMAGTGGRDVRHNCYTPQIDAKMLSKMVLASDRIVAAVGVGM